MSKISSIHAREVLDSRGHPTVEVDVRCECGAFGRGIVPSGASTGRAEAAELRDGDPNRYDGRGVLKAVANIDEQIAPEIVGREVAQQEEIDEALLDLDPSDRCEELGANALLGVSLAVAHAAAAALETPLWRHFNELMHEAARKASAEERTVVTNVCKPGARFDSSNIAPRMPVPMTNMISGGLHAGGKMPFQDFMVMPVGAGDYATGLEWIVRVYRRLGKILNDRGYESALVGDEGGYGPDLDSAEQAAELVVEAIQAAGLAPGSDMTLAIDVASSHFYEGEHYNLAGEQLTGEAMVQRLADLAKKYPIVSIEDGLAEEDWTHWQQLTQKLGDRVWLVGDDLFATNHKRIWTGVQLGAANSVLIKVNQIGTVSDALKTMALARLAGFGSVVSARSGETEDTTIADLAVGTGCGQIKIGSIVRGERLVKYNRLLRIAEELQAEEIKDEG